MGKINHNVRERILKYRRHGKNVNEILEILSSDGISVSRSGVYSFFRKVGEGGA